MHGSFVKSICVAEHRQAVIHVGRVHATSYTDNPNKHRQPVVQAGQAQATSYTSSASTGNQLYRQRKHRQSVIQAEQAQPSSYTRSASTGNASTGNQLHKQRKHRQLVIQASNMIFKFLPVAVEERYLKTFYDVLTARSEC
jgi:hypothetical protein